MKKNQIELMYVLKNVDKWLSAAEIAQRLEVHPNKVRRLIATAPFKDVEQAIYNTGKNGGGKYIKVYKIVVKKSNSDEALNLAKQHSGIWGQLNWSNQMKVERI